MFKIEWRIADVRSRTSETRVSRRSPLAADQASRLALQRVRPVRNRGGDERGGDRVHAGRQARTLRLKRGADEERMAVELESARPAGPLPGRDPKRAALEPVAMARGEAAPAGIAPDPP